MTLRTKMLIGAALACLAYVIVSREGSDEVELTHPDGSPQESHLAGPSTRGNATGMAARVESVLNRLAPQTDAAALFAPHTWYVAPPPVAPVTAQAPPAPQAPPLPFTFLGSYQLGNAMPVFYLTAGDRIYDVKVGDTLDHTYSIDGVQNGQLLLTYLPLKIQQSLTTGEGQ